MLPILLLRLALAFSFLYAGFASLSDPDSWIGFFPLWLVSLLPDKILLAGFAVLEIALGLWFIFGRALFYAASLAMVLLLGIVVFNFGALDLVFRDFSLALCAAALAVLSKRRKWASMAKC